MSVIIELLSHCAVLLSCGIICVVSIEGCNNADKQSVVHPLYHLIAIWDQQQQRIAALRFDKPSLQEEAQYYFQEFWSKWTVPDRTQALEILKDAVHDLDSLHLAIRLIFVERHYGFRKLPDRDSTIVHYVWLLQRSEGDVFKTLSYSNMRSQWQIDSLIIPGLSVERIVAENNAFYTNYGVSHPNMEMLSYWAPDTAGHMLIQGDQLINCNLVDSLRSVVVRKPMFYPTFSVAAIHCAARQVSTLLR